jgi:murein DD-endopeptidase MepM/ murein hydrolase activator NlpD
MISPSDGTGLMVFTEQSSFWNHFKFLSANPYFNLNNVLLGLYLSGLVRYVIVFIRNNAKIINLIQKSDIQEIEKYKIVLYKGKVTAFSWFSYIFINPRFLSLNQKEQAQIIEHEKIHARQLHSLDVLIYEILEIFFWFNPLVKKSKKTLKNIHEFIVDDEILNHTDAQQYSNLLIKLSVPNPDVSLANNFSKSPLLDRIWLMAFPTPERLRKIRFASGIPLMIAVLVSYSFIISEINRSTDRLQLYKKTAFEMPVKGDYQIVSLFFEKKPLNNQENMEKNDYQVLISHPEVSFSTESFSSVFATQKGIVKNIKKRDNWGIEEIEIEIAHARQFVSKYKGLEKSLVKKGDTVEQGQKIAKTGDNRLYPTISFQLVKKGKAVDPFEYIKR